MKHVAKLKLEREVKTFWDLNHASFVMLDLAKTVKEGSYYSLMASILFSAFTFEAYLNHLGSIKIKHWDEIERISVLSKYSVLCKEFDIQVNKGGRPFQTIKKLFEFRNSIAHGKSEILKLEKEVPIDTA